MEVNWHLVTLFAMEYINILDGINCGVKSIKIKNKKYDFVNEHICYSKY